MKIVYVIDSLASKGGAERILSEKMNYLATNFDYDVSVITCYQFIESMPNTYPLSEKVKQYNLSIPAYLQYKYHYPKRLWVKWGYYRELSKRLTETVNVINPDIIVGVGYVFADIVCRINCKAAKVIESHEARIFTLASDNFNNISPIFRPFYELNRKRYLNIVEKNADVVVTLTKDDAKNWRKAKRVEIIPNFSIMPISKYSDCESKRVIAVGRLGWQKAYDRLLSVWKLVSTIHPDWRLDIFGEGSLEMELRNIIKEDGLRNVSIHPFTNNISNEYANSSICVLTSRFEGFSLIILEAMRHGVPCISFDCPYGPKDLIDQGKSGFVIENGNIEQFSDRLNYLIEHIEMRKQLGNAAIKIAHEYNVDEIMKKWKTLFENLCA